MLANPVWDICAMYETVRRLSTDAVYSARSVKMYIAGRSSEVDLHEVLDEVFMLSEPSKRWTDGTSNFAGSGIVASLL
jgi:hypothetical protein